MINEPGHFYPGCSTAVGHNVDYRLGIIRDYGVLSGAWLDCGCADGGYTIGLARTGANQAVGVDRESDRLSIGNQQAKDSPAAGHVSFACTLSEALPFPDDTFDGVLLNEVLEHVTSERDTLREIHRVLRPGGHVVVMSPNRFFPFEGHGFHVGTYKYNAPVPVLHWLPRSIGANFMQARNYWPWELRDIVQAAGFSIVALSSALPVFDVYPWLPRYIIRMYQEVLPQLRHIPIVGGLGVSTFVLGKKASLSPTGVSLSQSCATRRAPSMETGSGAVRAINRS